jgi:pimeloyl-ACP methyl ester carboxylesterase
MFTFCLFAAALYMAAVFAVTLPYWYETINNPSKDIPSGSWSPRPVARLWLEAARCALLLGAAFPLDPILRRIDAKKNRHDAEDLPPVLLAHGLYHNPSGWMYLRGHLYKTGFRKIHTMAYSSRKTDIGALTVALDAAVRDLERRYPGKKPLLVGHSLGGLLIRNWLAAEENQARALGALTLGAPHQGSKLAALAFGALGRSLIPTNPFFADLARTEKAAAIPCVSLVSEADTMVLPQQSLVPVTKGWEMRLTPYATHAGIITRGAVCRMAAWELHRIVTMTARTPEQTPSPEAAAPEIKTGRAGKKAVPKAAPEKKTAPKTKPAKAPPQPTAKSGGKKTAERA